MRSSQLVFVVDDNPDSREVVGALLKHFGWTSRTFAAAADCVAALATRRPACIVSDVQMPRMTGLELLAYVRAQHPDIPVILISGSPGAEAQARDGGAAAFLHKPYDGEALIAAIRQVTSSPTVNGSAAARLDAT